MSSINSLGLGESRICSVIRREAPKVAAALVRLAAAMETGAGPPVYVRG